MMFELLQTVVLKQEIADLELRSGDLGTIVEIYGDDGIEVEFVSASGRTQALVSLLQDDVRAVDDSDLMAVRPLET